MDPTAYFHDGTDDALQNEVVVPSTRCPLDADSFTIFEASMSEVQGEDPWDITPYLHALEMMNRLKTLSNLDFHILYNVPVYATYVKVFPPPPHHLTFLFR